jgi:ABC-2 type transport system ATP-binding protein
MSLDPIAEVLQVSFKYPPSRRGAAARQALRGVTFSVEHGEIFGLLGPNGGGKTTLFRIISTLLVPSTGTVRIMGLDVGAHAHEVRRHLGVGFQSPSLDKKLTVEENLRHQGHLYGLSGTELKARAGQMLRNLGVVDRRRDLVETLSGGLARRVEIAKTLLHGPKLLLLDEPSTGLDPGARRELWEHFKRLREDDGVTILLTTHLMEEAAACDRLALIDQGELVALGSPAELTSEIGGDVISIRARDPESLSGLVKSQFGVRATVIDGTLRIEREAGHQFIPQLVEAFPGQIEAISVGRPTLEDVFVRRTGHALWEERR